MNLPRSGLVQQALLRSQIPSNLGQWIGDSSPDDPRIICISGENLKSHVWNSQFPSSLYTELSILNIVIPPIRARENDIPAIAMKLISDLEPDVYFTFDEEAMEILRSYPWPGNLVEMKFLIASMTLVSDGGEITASDLLYHFPWLEHSYHGNDEIGYINNNLESDAKESEQLETWLQEFSDQGSDVRQNMHAGLQRAIQLLMENYTEPITLQDLARAANLSASHLSFLFRDVVKTSFKDVQHYMRIKRAKELLRRERQMPIAEVAEAIGYADLSHFERSFRRRVGMRPRDYRRSTEPPIGADQT